MTQSLITDALGRQFQFSEPPRRIVSLVPSLTETLFDLGVGESVVGVTDFCIFPPNSLTRLGGTKNPRVHAVRELAPDLVYVNVEENLPHHAEAMRQFAPVLATHPKSVDDVVELICMLGEIHDRADRADHLAEMISTEAARPSPAFRFAVPIWKNPWMWCGGDTYVSDLVCSAGGINVIADEERYPKHDVSEVLSHQPDVIFLPDEPFVFRQEDSAMLLQAGTSRVVGPFPGHLFTWHGSRTLLGLRYLREVLGE